MRAQANYGDRELGHHAHVDADPVAFFDAVILQHIGELYDFRASRGRSVPGDALPDRSVPR